MRLTKTVLRQLGYDIFDIISFLVFVGGIILFIRFFIFHPYSVVGKSMLPTFQENDFILVDKLTPKLYDFKRGDIVVFIPPEKDIPYIKRVLGIPGDLIKIQSGVVTRCTDGLGQQQCTPLSEPYLGTGITTESFERNEFLVQSGGLFVMGDNRPHSTDSRACFGIGCIGEASFQVPFDHIIGKVFVRIRPKSKRYGL